MLELIPAICAFAATCCLAPLCWQYFWLQSGEVGAEMRRLKRENSLLKVENEMLKNGNASTDTDTN